MFVSSWRVNVTVVTRARMSSGRPRPDSASSAGIPASVPVCSGWAAPKALMVAA
ncbi:hypothetical protein J2809_000030 [Arthrobacter pascens]|uniref:hypothetical protein n=1 Tax=Arthrobacter pascens TaxID=1677 RepID=UPI00285EC7C9|nr:hypothetical protein [Arthrobacter pascens]MDR6555699.1 hypothetical protein [Arthrobacter pascens]